MRALVLVLLVTFITFSSAAGYPFTSSSRPSRAPASLDCPLRQLVASYASRLNSAANETDIIQSLFLSDLCPNASLLHPPALHSPANPFWEASPGGLCSMTSPPSLVYFVSPSGSDSGAGTLTAPFATLERALGEVSVVRGSGAETPACIWMRGGKWRVSSAVQITIGAIEIAAYGGETPVLSGAISVATPSWKQFSVPSSGAMCWLAEGVAPQGLNVSSIFDDGGLALMRARWPNSNVSGNPYPGAWSTDDPHTWAPAPSWSRCESSVVPMNPPVCFSNYTTQGGMDPCYQARTGCGSLRFDPPIEPGTPRGICGDSMSPLCNTVPGGITGFSISGAPLPWAHPEDAVVHAMKRISTVYAEGDEEVKTAPPTARGYGWYSLSWEVAGEVPGGFTFGTGGFQSSQGVVADGPDFSFFIEGALELLDYPGEWHYDSRTGSVYLCTAAATGDVEPLPSSVDLAVSQYLVNVQGESSQSPLTSVSLRGLRFERTRSTMLEPHGVPGGGDLAAHPRGAVTITNTEGLCVVAGCSFWDIGGTAVAITGHAEGVQVVDSDFLRFGAHAILILGTAQLANATGPDLPRGSRIAGNTIRGGGRENKFAAPIALALAPASTVEGNVVYDCSRTAIYFNDQAGSPSQLMRNNVLFNNNRETTDTGPVYVYNRLAFTGDGAPDVMSNHSQNLIMSNYGANWPLDYDDGTRHIHNSGNVFIYGGNKQYLGCCTTHSNNYALFPDLSDQAWSHCVMSYGAEMYKSGYGHVYENNTCLLSSATAAAYDYGSCSLSNALSPPRTASEKNMFLLPGGVNLSDVRVNCQNSHISMEEWQAASGFDMDSSAGPLPQDISAYVQMLYSFLPGPEEGGRSRSRPAR